MGILLRDQRVLYGSLNLGTIETGDTGTTGGDDTPSTTRSLPSGAFAVYDKRSAPTYVSGTNPYYLWNDVRTLGTGETTRPMKIFVDDGNSPSKVLWNPSQAYLFCSDYRRSVRGVTTNSNGTTPVSGFTPANGYTLNALVEYTEATGAQDDPIFKPNGLNGLNQDDIVFSVGAQHKEDGKRSWYGLGKRYGDADNVDPSILSGNYTRLFYYGDEINGANGEWKYSAWQINYISSISGVHLLTWVVNAGCSKCVVYFDGNVVDSIEGFDITKTIAGDTPNLYYFAPHHEVPVTNNTFNFFGKVYAISVYNRPLDMTALGECVSFYKELYADKQYSPRIPVSPAASAEQINQYASDARAAVSQFDENDSVAIAVGG